jgi:BMFP domain-containing protein YqiC
MLFEEMSKIMGGAFATMATTKAEVEQKLKSCFEQYLAKMNYVSREDFELVQAMLQRQRMEQEVLVKRVERLEQQANKKKKDVQE